MTCNVYVAFVMGCLTSSNRVLRKKHYVSETHRHPVLCIFAHTDTDTPIYHLSLCPQRPLQNYPVQNLNFCLIQMQIQKFIHFSIILHFDHGLKWLLLCLSVFPHRRSSVLSHYLSHSLPSPAACSVVARTPSLFLSRLDLCLHNELSQCKRMSRINPANGNEGIWWCHPYEWTS